MTQQKTVDRIEYRFLLRCRTTTPLTHGSGSRSAVTDNPLRRTAAGEIVIAGTAIAGLLRTLVERQADHACFLYADEKLRRSLVRQPCGCAVCRLFGNVIPVDSAEDALAAQKARASRVWVHDAVVAPSRGSRIVDSVGISRERRAAEDAKKFDREELPVNTLLLLEIRAESPTIQERQWIETALRWLATGVVGLGGGAASGSGLLACEQAAIYRRDLSKRDHLLAAVLNDSHAAPDSLGEELPGWPDVDRKPLDQYGNLSVTFEQLRWEFLLEPNTQEFGGTFLVSDPTSAAASNWDRAPRGLSASSFAAELPSRSVRGALRSGAERILQTVRPDVAADASKRLFGSVDNASTLRVMVKQHGPATASPWDHVSIDRFTGGARDGRKFDAVAARGGAFQLSLTLVNADESDLTWMKGLLALTLRDLHDGRITIGHGAAKGHGYFRLASLDVTTGTDDWTSVLTADESVTPQQWIDALATASFKAKTQQDADSIRGDDGQLPSHSSAGLSSPRLHAHGETPSAKQQDQAGELATPDDPDQHTSSLPVPWIARSGRASTDILYAVADGLAVGEIVAFLESPTHCVMRRWSDASFDWRLELGTAWHFRLFADNLELAARRLSFDEGKKQWSIRLVAHEGHDIGNVSQHFSSEAIRLDDGELVQEETVQLLGSTQTAGGQFSEQRFAAASEALFYPGQWEAQSNARLRLRRFEHTSGGIVCWMGLEKTPSEA